MVKEKIGIIGAGPIGSIMAACLSRHKEKVYLADIKKDLIDQIKNQGLRVTGILGDFHTKMTDVCYSISELSKFDINLLFIAVKTSALEVVTKEIEKIFNPQMKIIALQNGIDNEDLLANYFGQENVFRIVVNYAGNMHKPGIVEITFFHPPNYIGGLSEKTKDTAKEIANLISNSGLKTEFSDEIKKHEWRKTILNAGLSPVCAITGLTMKEAMELKETRYLCEKILQESIKVAEKIGYDYGEDFYEKCISYLTTAGYHKPSMLIDLEQGNPTEIDFINQKIIYYGKKTKVPTPYLDSLTNIIKVMEYRAKEKKNKRN
ncbi:MAG: ketopantoate reductase family protein [Candidatus Aminicenantia bacterium]